MTGCHWSWPDTCLCRLRNGSKTERGATYRVVEFLQQEALIERIPRGPIVNVQWRQLLERWAQDYGFQESNVTRSYLQPRGSPLC